MKADIVLYLAGAARHRGCSHGGRFVKFLSLKLCWVNPYFFWGRIMYTVEAMTILLCIYVTGKHGISIPVSWRGSHIHVVAAKGVFGTASILAVT